MSPWEVDAVLTPPLTISFSTCVWAWSALTISLFVVISFKVFSVSAGAVPLFKPLLKISCCAVSALDCLDNELDYDEQHYENIKRIDDFVNKKGIIDVLDACGDATSSSYKFHEELEEWLYLVWFPNKELVALIDDETIQIKRTN